MFFTLALVLSCTKSELTELSPDPVTDNSQIDYTISSISDNESCDPAFPLNDYDSTGVMHNHYLDLIASTLENYYLDASENERWNAVDFLLQTEENQNYTLPLSEADLDFAGLYYETNSNLDSIWLEYSQTAYIGSRANVLQDIVQQYDGTNLCSIVESIKLFEEEEIILANSQGDIEQILGAASVARFSLSFWDSNYSTYLYSGSVNREVPWRKIIRIALADAGGALAGSPLGTFGMIVMGATASWNEFENQFPDPRP